MPLNFKYQKYENYIVVDKPYGISTHAVDATRPGAAELFSRAVQQDSNQIGSVDSQLKVIHRLDSTTTGVLVFGLDQISTSVACQAFFNGSAIKKYLFITDRRAAVADPIHHSSIIEKQSGGWVSLTCSQPNSTRANAVTTFTPLASHGTWSLWQASPSTGKTHQVRLHAKDLGIPILGDELYGGTRFPQIMLHAAELQLPSLPRFESPSSLLMQNLELCNNITVATWILALERRNRLFEYQANDCLRMIHTEGKQLRADRMGEVLCIYWYHETPPEQWALDAFKLLTSLAHCKQYVLYWRSKESQCLVETPKNWIACENGLNFQLRSGHGISPGLFLDQRQQRARVLGNAQGKSLLNLFCYSCGFSVAAAKAGASSVVSVDVSKSALEWGKTNLELNGIHPDTYVFSALDSRDYLRLCKKQGRVFDIVVCDPPSFSHGKKKVFSLEREMHELISDCLSVIAPNGELYFSCNHERIDQAYLHRTLSKLAPPPDWQIEAIPSGLDYELPGQEPLLKSFIVKRNQG